MKKDTIVNIYNFIRRSHQEPSQFIVDDFETIKRQMEVLKQYGLPSTYALKHDALMDKAYQELIFSMVDPYDEIGAWWEITGELCKKAGVEFLGGKKQIFDNRVNTAYSPGYPVSDRKALIDAYMDDFKSIFSEYPKSIGSWILDIETIRYAKEAYGLKAAAICRDQLGVDGFTLWGGYVNGVYYPSQKNEYLPAQTLINQVDIPVFRLLGPDPIRCFESGIRENMYGVFSLEPACTVGRDEQFVDWMFECLTKEDTLGLAYAQVGQENNFLWENIKPGFELQLSKIQKRSEQGQLKIETMKETAEWFTKKYKTTPPLTYQASHDWMKDEELKTMWYSCKNYRISFLEEKGSFYIRDFFLYDEAYPSRFLTEGMKTGDSLQDALPIVYPQLWKKEGTQRQRILFTDADGKEKIIKEVVFEEKDSEYAKITLTTECETIEVTLSEQEIAVSGSVSLCIVRLPVLKTCNENEFVMEHEGFTYRVFVKQGTAVLHGEQIILNPSDGELILCLSEKQKEELFTREYQDDPKDIDDYIPEYKRIPPNTTRNFKEKPPVIVPQDQVFEVGTRQVVRIEANQEDELIYYTLDNTQPDETSVLYKEPFTIEKETVIKAIRYRNKKESETAKSHIFFGMPVETIESDTKFDPRVVFNRNGIKGLLGRVRGSLDYQDGNWLGTQMDLKAVITLAKETLVSRVTIGFISNHRSGIIYPQKVLLYAGEEKDNLSLVSEIVLPNEPAKREIDKLDVVFETQIKTKYLKLESIKYEIFPEWSCYKGCSGVFIMADTVIVE